MELDVRYLGLIYSTFASELPPSSKYVWGRQSWSIPGKLFIHALRSDLTGTMPHYKPTYVTCTMYMLQ